MDIQLFRISVIQTQLVVASGSAILTLPKQASNMAIGRYFSIRNFSHCVVYGISPSGGFL